MPINVYPSLMPGRPVEVHAYAGGTVGAWLDSHGLDWRNQSPQPVCIAVNGRPIAPEMWDVAALGADDVVDVRIVPHGGLFKAIGSIVGGIIDFAFGWLMPSSDASNTQTLQGEQLETSEAKANTAKLGEVVPELAGRFKRFPDYLTPPRRYFSAPREQYLEFLCCVGPGRYEIAVDEVFIGDTPFASMGGNAEYILYEPGTSVTGHTAHEHWYTVSEVGGTSSGTAGLELSAEFSSDVVPPAGPLTFDGDQISISSGAFPASWGSGTRIDLVVPQSYVVSAVFDPISESSVNRFTGNWRELDPSVSMQVGVESEELPAAAYVIRAMGIDSSGVGWVELQDELGGVVANVADGTYSMAFYKPGRSYQLTSRTDTTLEIEALFAGAVESGWAGFPNVTATGAITDVDPNTVYGEWTSLFMACPGAETTTTFELDFFFQSGLAYINDDGGLDERTVQVEIEYRDANGPGAWNSAIKLYTARTLDQIGFTERFDVAAMRPEVRVRRVGAQDTSTQVQDTILWYGLRSRLPTTDSYPGWTTMAVRILGAGKIAARSENQVSVIATRILPTLQPDGTWGAEQPTRAISAFAKYISNTIGYTDNDIDMDEFRRLHDIWEGRDETLDYVYDETTVRDALMLAFGAGMGEFTIDDGRIRPVRDGVRTSFEQAYSPQNMTGPLRRTFRSARIDDIDGVQVEYTDGESWTKQTIDCLLPGDPGFKLEKINIKGVVTRTRAWRIGMRRRRAARYRSWEYRFGTEMDALNSGYMGYVALLSDVAGYGQSALLEHVERQSDGVLLVVGEPMAWHSNTDHVVAFRWPDGTLAGPFSAQPGADDYQIIADLPDPLPVVNLKQELPHVYFGTVERWSYPALVTEVTAQGMDTVSVTAMNYDARVYADDDGSPA